MKVVLLQNIKGYGRIGDIKNVSDGHARNFLLPRKLAKAATEGIEREAESFKQKREASAEREKAQANAAVVALSAANLTLSKKAGPTGTLFSSVSKDELAKELSRVSGFKIDEDMIDLGEHGEHLKHIGEHSISVE